MATSIAGLLNVRLLVVVPLLACAAFAQSRPTFVHSSPIEAAPGEPLVIEGEAIGDGISAVVVQARGPKEPWEEYALALQYGDLYRGQLPPSRVMPPWVEYYVEAVLKSGARVTIFATAKQPVRVIVNLGGPAPLTEKKCKRVKKGKRWVEKCVEVPLGEEDPDAEPEPAPSWRDLDPEPEPEPTPVPEKKREPEKKPEPEKKAEPEKKPEPEKRAEPEPAKRTEPERRPEPERAPPSELEEELALYGAEASGGVVQRVTDDLSQSSPLLPTVLDHRAIKRLGARYVHEVLDVVPGLSVSRDVQGFWRVAMRGLRNEAELLFTLNGQRLNNFYDQRVLDLPVDNLERIEIYRGPATADVPLGNTTGVINLVTRKDQGLRASVSGGVGLAFDGHVNGAFSAGPVTVYGDVDVAHQEGQRLPVPRDYFDAAGTETKVTSDQRFLLNAGLGVKLDLGEAGVIEASGRALYEDRAGLVGLFDVLDNDARLTWLTGQAQLGWSKELEGIGRVQVRAWFDHQATQRQWHQTRAGFEAGSTTFPDGVQEQISVTALSVGVHGRGDFKLPFNNQLTAGVQLEHQALTSLELLSNADTDSGEYIGSLRADPDVVLPTATGAASRFTGSVYVYDTWTPVDVVSVQAGLRFDLVGLPGGVTPGFGPRVGVTVTPIKPLALRLNYGRSFRAPSVKEYAEAVIPNDYNAGRFIGNLTLEPAYLDAVEASAEYVQGLGEGRLRLRGAFFFERLSNAVLGIDTSGNFPQYDNRLLGVQSLGLEGEARLELTKRLHVWLNASWVRAEDLTTPQQSRLLTDVPQLRANGGATVPLGPWLNLDVVARFASERRNNTRSVLELIRRYTLPGYATFGAQLRTEPIFGYVELLVLGQNVFNLEYADDAPRPDRINNVPRDRWSLFGQVKVSF